MSRRTLRLVEEKKRRKKISSILRICMLIIVISLLVFVGVYFRTTKIRITGNETYSEKEMIKAVKSKHYVGNTLLMILKSKVIEEEYYPFVDYVTMSFSNSHILDVAVKELPRAGMIKQGKYYMYFNYSGLVVEKSKKKFDGVPLIEDTKLGKTKLNEPIAASEDVKRAIVSTAKNLSQKNLTAKSITVDKKGKITVICDEYEIRLGDVSYIEAKISKLPEILETIKTEYKSGIIDMTLYTDDQEIITYHEN